MKDYFVSPLFERGLVAKRYTPTRIYISPQPYYWEEIKKRAQCANKISTQFYARHIENLIRIQYGIEVYARGSKCLDTNAPFCCYIEINTKQLCVRNGRLAKKVYCKRKH